MTTDIPRPATWLSVEGRAALRFASMLATMTGMTLAAGTGFVAWLRTPERLHLLRVGQERALVIGGDAVASLLPRLLSDFGIAAACVALGLCGLLLVARASSSARDRS